MREFDYVIIGGGCAGLSLAYELEIHEKLKDKTLAIIEPRDEYKRDKICYIHTGHEYYTTIIFTKHF